MTFTIASVNAGACPHCGDCVSGTAAPGGGFALVPHVPGSLHCIATLQRQREGWRQTALLHIGLENDGKRVTQRDERDYADLKRDLYILTREVGELSQRTDKLLARVEQLPSVEPRKT